MIPWLFLDLMLLGSGLMAWGIAAQKLDRAKNVRQSAARRERAALLAEEAARRERLEAAWLYSQAHQVSRSEKRTAEDAIQFAQTLQG